MIKGLAITPPVIGRISIGRLVCKNDKWLPEKDDSFTLTHKSKTRGNGYFIRYIRNSLKPHRIRKSVPYRCGCYSTIPT